MTKRLSLRALLLLLSGSLVLSLHALETTARDSNRAPAPASIRDGVTNSFHPITPGPIDGRIAFLTAAMLEKNQYLKMPFDAAVSSKFLNEYVDTLDPQHIHFTQGDMAEFEAYRTNLDRLTLSARHVGDTRPGCVIFNRFFERLSQRTAYAEDLLNHEKFTFDDNERILLNRKGQPFPKDLNEAKKLWRDRLRFEYLQELLGKIEARKKPQPVATNAGAGSPVAAPAHAAGNNAQEPAIAEADQHRQPALQSPKASSQDSATAPTAGQTHAPGAPGSGADLAASAIANSELPTKKEAEEIVATLTHRYHRNLRFFEDWNNEDVLQVYLSALAHVYDPHSDYLGRQQLEGFAMQMNLSLFGIGAELTLSDDGYCTIRRLLRGGPAMKSKLIKENDRIVAVAQGDEPWVDVVDMSLNKAVQLIRGPKGTVVRLTVIPAGSSGSERKIVTLVRDEIPLDESAAKAQLIDLPDNNGGKMRLGVIDLPSFYATFDPVNTKDKPEPKSTTVDVARLLKKLKKEKVQGIILDLRHNGGGSLEEAIKLTGLFIKTGPVVQVKELDESVQEADDTDPSVLYDGPLIVLTSRGSASASEIVAGALQDYGRALVVGDRSTHGKGTVQSVTSLRPYMHLADASLTNDPGALKLTIKKFYRPSGASTQLRGVVPDIILPSVANESKDIGESALDNPLQWDTVPPAKFEHLDRVQPYVEELRRRSAARIACDKDYSYIREDIERFKQHEADKTISLSEQARLKETEELDARSKARDKERRARPEPPEKVYELTLQNVDQAGLPAPLTWTNGTMVSLSPKPLTTLDGTATNSASATSPKPAVPDHTEDLSDGPGATPDASLDEAEHILVDYLSLLPKGEVVTTEH
jgi:carboxyl-terminal processing protease